MGRCLETIDKNFDQISAVDVSTLCTEAAYESQLLEFKRELPADRDRPDPSPAGGNFTASARDQLLREVVAFANAQGGTVIVGIEETKDDPPRAARHSSDPPHTRSGDQNGRRGSGLHRPGTPGLLVRGIEVGGGPGEGVLLFRTGPSPAGPHRVRKDGHAYIRRGASSVQMTMREIQDLTIDNLRGSDRLDSILRERQARFREWLELSDAECGACRITAAPLGGLAGGFPGLPRQSSDPNAFPIKTRFRANYGSVVDLAGPSMNRFRQIVRGFRWSDEDNSVRYEVYESGLIDLWYRHRLTEGNLRVHFYVGWLLGAYLSVLEAVDTARAKSNVPEWEFAIEVVLDGITHTPRHGGGMVPLGAVAFGAFDRPYEVFRVDELPVKFPRVPHRSSQDREAVLNLFLADLIDAGGGPRDNLAIKLL